jgi:AcrR family transcriptional regulator
VPTPAPTPARALNGALEPKQARSQATRRRLLDAAVEELAEAGYANLTTASVAHRAGVSRGAQQHHFPQKTTLVAEAVAHLAALALDQIRETSARAASGTRRTEEVLDLLYELYSGPLFISMLELTLAARSEPELAALVSPIDRNVGRQFRQHAAELFGDAASAPDFDLRLRHVVATIRGLALRRLDGRRRAEAAQWRFTRAELVRTLDAR